MRAPAAAVLAAVLAVPAGAAGASGAAKAPAAAFASQADCLARASIEGLLAMAAGGKPLPVELQPLMDGIVQYSFRYFTCRSFVEGRGVCKKLEPYDGWTRPRPSLECERYGRELEFVHALMTGKPEASALCLEGLRHPEDREFEPQHEERACAIVLEKWSRPREACAALEPMFKKHAQVGKCRAWLDGINGRAPGCAGTGENDVKERCLAYAAFRKARSGAGRGACAEQPICRLFMGEGLASCRPYEDRVKKAVCSVYAPGKRGALSGW